MRGGNVLGLIVMFGLVYLIGTTFGDNAGVVAISVAILMAQRSRRG